MLEPCPSADFPTTTAILEQLPAALVLLDPLGRIRSMNALAELRLGMSSSEALDRDLFREVVPELECLGWGSYFRQAIATRALAAQWESMLTRSSGERLLGFRLSSIEIGGEPWGAVVIEDRTVIVRERKLREQLEPFAAIGGLAAGAGHEINNPLASISGFAQLLTTEAADRERTTGLRVIHQEAARIAGVVNRLLDFARQQHNVGRELLDLNRLLTDVLALRRYTLESSGIRVGLELAPDLPRVEGSCGALQRLILILICRAERALFHRADDRQLTLYTSGTHEAVVLTLSDNGPAEPALVRGHRPEEEPDRPCSFWMSSAQAITRSFGGALFANRCEEFGTTLSVRFPRAGTAGTTVGPEGPHPFRRAALSPAHAESLPTRIEHPAAPGNRGAASPRSPASRPFG